MPFAIAAFNISGDDIDCAVPPAHRGGTSTNWASVCPDDSDGDRLSNGEELGDPDCIWTAGAVPSAEVVTNPGEAGGCSSTGTGNAGVVALLGVGLTARRRRRR